MRKLRRAEAASNEPPEECAAKNMIVCFPQNAAKSSCQQTALRVHHDTLHAARDPPRGSALRDTLRKNRFVQNADSLLDTQYATHCLILFATYSARNRRRGPKPKERDN